MAAHSLIASEVGPQEIAPLFKDFDCGLDDAALLATQWIKGPAVQQSIARGTKVISYKLSDGSLVGFGSYGTTEWRLPIPDGPKTRLALLPMLAVHADFQGKPPGLIPSTERYSGQIVADLITRSATLKLPLVGLFVHMRNGRAISLYRAMGFESLPDRVRPFLVQMVRELP